MSDNCAVTALRVEAWLATGGKHTRDAPPATLQLDAAGLAARVGRDPRPIDGYPDAERLLTQAGTDARGFLLHSHPEDSHIHVVNAVNDPDAGVLYLDGQTSDLASLPDNPAYLALILTHPPEAAPEVATSIRDRPTPLGPPALPVAPLDWAATLLDTQPSSFFTVDQTAKVAQLISRSAYWSAEQRARILDAATPDRNEFIRLWHDADADSDHRSKLPSGRFRTAPSASLRLFHLLTLWIDSYAPRTAPAATPGDLNDLGHFVALVERRDGWPRGTDVTAEHLRQEYRDLAHLPASIWVDDLDVTELASVIGRVAGEVGSKKTTHQEVATRIDEWALTLGSGRPWPGTPSDTMAFHPARLHPALARVTLDDELTANQAIRIERVMAELDSGHADDMLSSLSDDQKELADLWLVNMITQLSSPVSH